tara:strand:+ start:255 stop:530 length:276 start_codon:yes stop_codon:yes gene_type:complete
MSTGIKNIKVDENNNAFVTSTKAEGEGSIFVKVGDDYILQDDVSSGTGMFLIDITTTNSSGVLTVSPPVSVLTNLDANFELDANNDIAPKT